jgi:SHAQKYF class myb-like DNA-binding protein
MSFINKSDLFPEDDHLSTSTKPINLFESNIFRFCISQKSDSRPSSIPKLVVTSKQKPKRNQQFKLKKPKNEKKKEKPIKKTKNGDFTNGRWTQEEHKRFIESILKYGNEWRKVEEYIGTRSSTQARSHAQKFFDKMKIANIIDEEVVINSKTSIKSLHAALKHMEKENYLFTVEDLNGIPFERKRSNVIKGNRNKNQANNESIPENFGDLDSYSCVESKQPLANGDNNENKEENEDPTSTKASSITLKDKELNLVNELSVKVESNNNKLLKNKRLRKISLNSNSIDVDKQFGQCFEFDDKEIDDYDFQNIIILQMFEKKAKIEKEDYEDNERIFYLDKDLDKENTLSNEFYNGDELFKEYFD